MDIVSVSLQKDILNNKYDWKNVILSNIENITLDISLNKIYM